MATDYSEEPKCTQKGTGWVTFDSSPNPTKKRIIRKKMVRRNKL
jgi:hypothetical protein